MSNIMSDARWRALPKVARAQELLRYRQRVIGSPEWRLYWGRRVSDAEVDAILERLEASNA